MEPDAYLQFIREAHANERQNAKESLGDVLDAGDRILAQHAAGAVISATSMLIREQERGNPT